MNVRRSRKALWIASMKSSERRPCAYELADVPTTFHPSSKWWVLTSHRIVNGHVRPPSNSICKHPFDNSLNPAFSPTCFQSTTLEIARSTSRMMIYACVCLLKNRCGDHQEVDAGSSACKRSNQHGVMGDRTSHSTPIRMNLRVAQFTL